MLRAFNGIVSSTQVIFSAEVPIPLKAFCQYLQSKNKKNGALQNMASIMNGTFIKAKYEKLCSEARKLRKVTFKLL